MKEQKKYRITFSETVVHTFDVFATSLEEAEGDFHLALHDGRLDFSDGEVTDSEYTITPV